MENFFRNPHTFIIFADHFSGTDGTIGQVRTTTWYEMAPVQSITAFNALCVRRINAVSICMHRLTPTMSTTLTFLRKK